MKYLVLIALSTFLMMSCGKDVECTPEAFTAETTDEFNALQSASDAFNAENSKDNCEDLKEAAEKYVDAIKEFEGCDGIDPASYQAALDIAESNVAQLPACE